MKLRTLTPMGEALLSLCSDAAGYWFGEGCGNRSEEELVVVTPDTLSPEHIDTPEGVVWGEIHRAWKEIQSSEPERKMWAWRTIEQHGKEIGPGLRVYRFRDSETDSYFCHVPGGDLFASLDRLINLFFVLSAWQHITHGKSLFHAAGVVRNGATHLFFGPSGAGKSTVANLSVARGCTVTHDDHVTVYSAETGRYLVRSLALPTQGIPLAAVFFLTQDTVDQLVSLSSHVTAQRLLESFFDAGGRQVLFGQTLKDAFAVCADVARSVPGYELHFRKSPDFWNVIDAELGT